MLCDRVSSVPGACGPGVAARVLFWVLLDAFRVLLVRLRLLYLCWVTDHELQRIAASPLNPNRLFGVLAGVNWGSWQTSLDAKVVAAILLSLQLP